MTELYVTVADALRRSPVMTIALAVEGKLPELPRPIYLPDVPVQTVSEYRAALAKLTLLGIVKEA